MKKRLRKLISASLGTAMALSTVAANVLPAAAYTADEVDLTRKIAQEGIVLLENENEALPLAKGESVALFGRATVDYTRGGGGSGETNVDFVWDILDGMEAKEEEGKVVVNKDVADFYRQKVDEEGITDDSDIDVTDEMIAKAASESSTAIITIGRTSSEGYDIEAVKGDYYLSDAEESLIKRCAAAFDKTIVLLNIGAVRDTSWYSEIDGLDALVCIYQGGMEGGLAAADVLVGDVNPSGKTVDTWADSYEAYRSSDTFGARFDDGADYSNYEEDIFVGYRYFETFDPDYKTVNYPFGYGLSYTDFEITKETVTVKDDEIVVSAYVENVGDTAGKEVVQTYFSAPQGKLGKPAKELAAYAKTRELEPGERQKVTMSFDIDDMASYDDTGKVQKSAWLLEAGDYDIYVGNSIKDAGENGVVDTYVVEETTVTEQLSEQCAPTQLEKRLLADGSWDYLESYLGDTGEEEPVEVQSVTAVSARTVYSAEKTADDSGLTDEDIEKAPIQLIDVKNDLSLMDDFVAQITDGDIINMLGGQTSTGYANTGGIGNMWYYGIPNTMTADGPQGVRLNINTTGYPIGTLLASTWNEDLAKEMGLAIGTEAKEYNIDIWLAPGMNIHRDPLCGRNFEYYSEDPLVTGKTAAALTKGVQSKGVSVTLKHFCANNCETNRTGIDARMSERALREIYLKGFQIAVEEADPWCIMSSYNKLNGVETAENYELLTNIARNEWGWQGMFMTDWANDSNHAKELLAGNDVKMPSGSVADLKAALADGTITRADLERSMKRICNMIIKTNAIDRGNTLPSVLEITDGAQFKLMENILRSETVCSGYGFDGGLGSVLANTEPGAWAEYRINANEAGQYSVDVRYSDLDGTGAFDVYIDNEKVGSVQLEATGALPLLPGLTIAAYATMENAITLNLSEGLHLLRLEWTAAGSQINWIQFNYAGEYIEPEPEPEPVNKEELEAAIEAAEAVNPEDWEQDEAWTAFEQALEAAKAVLEDEEAYQDAVDAAAQALKDAAAALNEKAPEPELADKEELKKAIQAAEALNADDYAQDNAWKAFELALTEAKAVDEDEEASQLAVDIACNVLNKAVSALNEKAEPEPEPEPDEDKGVAIYRAYNPNDGDHLYTSNRQEFINAIAAGWNDEGTAWVSPSSGTPVYRVYDKNSGEHHYTTDEHEVETLVKSHGWRYEQIAWYSADAETGTKVHRLYNPNATGAGRHHWTTSELEYKTLTDLGWKYEDNGFHALSAK